MLHFCGDGPAGPGIQRGHGYGIPAAPLRLTSFEQVVERREYGLEVALVESTGLYPRVRRRSRLPLRDQRTAAATRLAPQTRTRRHHNLDPVPGRQPQPSCSFLSVGIEIGPTEGR